MYPCVIFRMCAAGFSLPFDLIILVNGEGVVRHGHVSISVRVFGSVANRTFRDVYGHEIVNRSWLHG